MAHAISMINGRGEMFSGRNMVPWHQKETNSTVVKGMLKSAEAIQAAHLGWGVGLEPIYASVTQPDGSVTFHPVKDYQRTARMDNHATLGIVKGRYEIIQNTEAFGMMDVLVGEGKAVYDTAGALHGGKQVWIAAKYDGDIQINNDKHEQWLLLVTSHDGMKCLTLQWVTVRVVCANTLSLALGKTVSNKISIRHTATWKDHEQEARRVLGLTDNYFNRLKEGLAMLGTTPMLPQAMTEFGKLLFKTEDEKKVPTRTQNMRDELNRLFGKGAGNRGATRWDALNAVTDYVDHQSVTKGDGGRMESALMGNGQRLKQQAYDYLTSEELMASLLEKPVVSGDVRIGASDFAQLLAK